jgi:hypothetical protein
MLVALSLHFAHPPFCTTNLLSAPHSSFLHHHPPVGTTTCPRYTGNNDVITGEYYPVGVRHGRRLFKRQGLARIDEADVQLFIRSDRWSHFPCGTCGSGCHVGLVRPCGRLDRYEEDLVDDVRACCSSRASFPACRVPHAVLCRPCVRTLSVGAVRRLPSAVCCLPSAVCLLNM